jgi:hypothetical protein
MAFAPADFGPTANIGHDQFVRHVPWVFFTTPNQIQLEARGLLATAVSARSNFRVLLSRDKLKAPASSGAFLCQLLIRIFGWHETNMPRAIIDACHPPAGRDFR